MKICVDKYLKTKALRIKSAEHAIDKNPNNQPIGRFSHPLALALETGKKWPVGSIIKCAFMGGSNIQRTKVEREAHKWETYANIKFSFIENINNSDVRIAFDTNDGSWSYIGMDCKFIPVQENTMNFGWLFDDTDDGEYQRVVLHEFGHSLGAIHEHQSPATSIPWDKEAVYKYYTGPPNNWTRDDVDVNLFAKYDATITQFSQFDKQSIMLYSIPNDLTIGDYEVGWNDTLSDTDKLFMKQCYPFNNTPVIAPKSLEIIPGGAPVVGSLMGNAYQDITMNLGFSQGGIYQFSSYPTSLWISVWFNGKNIGYGKNGLKLKLGAGQYKVRVRHSIGTGIFNIGARKV